MMFFFTVFKGMFDFWDTLFISWFKIKFLNSFFPTLTKLKLALFLHWFLMATTHGWFLYFEIVFMVESLILSKKSSLFEYLLLMSRFCTMFEKKNHLESLRFLDPFLQVPQLLELCSHLQFYQRFYCLQKEFIIKDRFFI